MEKFKRISNEALLTHYLLIQKDSEISEIKNLNVH